MKKICAQAPREILPQMMRRLYETDLNTSKGGNLSMQAEDGRWCTPSGLDKADMTPEDMLFFRSDGAVVGRHDVSIETYIHMNIMDRCAGRKAVIHAHDLPLIEYSVMHRPPNTKLYPTRLMGQRVPVLPFRIPGSQGLADGLVEAFNETGATCAILANHGAFFADENMFRALESLEAADFLCRTEQAAAAMGDLSAMPDDGAYRLAQYTHSVMPLCKRAQMSPEEELAAQELSRLHARSYRRRMFAANMGLIAVRLNGTDFMIPLEDCDRNALRPEDFVTVRDGKLPEGAKQPRYAAFLDRVFRSYPQVNAISVAQPAYAMVFAVTLAALDSRVLPESYSKLRAIRRLPFGSLLADEESVGRFDPSSCPVTIVDNECIVCMGKTAFDAFECCELVEEYARIQVHICQMEGKAIPLTDTQLREVLLEEGRKAETDMARYANRLRA